MKGEMDIISKGFLKRGITLIAGIAAFVMAVFPKWPVRAEENTRGEQERKVVAEFVNPNSSILLSEKLLLVDLEKKFPKEMEVLFTDGTTGTIAVTWECECDYDKENYDTYVFEVRLPEEYKMSEECIPAYIRVDMKNVFVSETYKVYEPNTNGTTTLDTYLGVTGDIVSYLESYETSTYYLGTPYYGAIYNGNIDHCLVARGEGANGVTTGMNCAGFVGNVLRHLGGDLSKIGTRMNYHYANAVNWQDTAHLNRCMTYRFTSISEMLASGILEKGDILYFEPDWTLPNVDCHMGFFWGDTSNDNKFWHSSSSYDNAITEIKSKSSFVYVYVFKTAHKGNLEVLKTPEDAELLGYSLEGAEFGVYEDFACANQIGKLTAGADGKTNSMSLKAGTYYVKEIKPPKGFVLNDEVKTIIVKAGQTTSCSIADSSNQIKIVKRDRESGHTLAGVVVKIWKKDGENAGGFDTAPEYTTNQKGEILLKALSPGHYYVKESKAAPGYLLPDTLFEFVVSEDGTIHGAKDYEIRIENEKMRYSIQVHKKDGDGKSLNGAEFTLYEDQNLMKEVGVSTVADGRAYFEHLEQDKKYYLKETKVPQGYYGDEDENGKRRVYEIYAKADEQSGDLHYYVNGILYHMGSPSENIFVTEGQVLHMEIINKKGYLLPETGSKAMLPLLLIGVAAVICSIEYGKNGKKY